MKYKRYMHIERYGVSKKVEGIERGKCYIFPKIDGTNTQTWVEDGKIKVGKRKETSQMETIVYETITNDKNIENFLIENNNLKLYGEFLTPHTLRDYDKNAWNKFYVFDVEEFKDGKYKLMDYDRYSRLLDKYGILYIKPLAIIDYPTTEDFSRLLEENKYLITEKEGVIGEGIIIKNYEYISKQTQEQIHAKIIRSEFKAKQHKLEYDTTEGTYIQKTVEEKIAEEYFTDAFLEKELNKALNILFDGEIKTKEDRKRIPELFDFVFYAFVEEDMRNVLEKYNKPNISFLQIYNLCRARIKVVSPIFKK